MGNSVAVVNSDSPPKCDGDITCVEICERNVHEISYVDEDGQPTGHKETYLGEAEFAYYYCTQCGEDWSATAVQNQEQAWKLVKEHFDDGPNN